MSRTTPGKARGKTAQQPPPGGNRTIGLVLAGLTALVIVAIALFAVFSASGGDTGNFTPNDEGLIPPGERAPSFTAETVNGGNVFVGEGDSQPTMLVFFATWCPHCQKEAPVISELEEQYDGLDEYGSEGPAFYEPSIGTRYGVSGYPTVYVLDRNNRVVGAHSGEAPRSVFEGWVEEAL